MALIPFFLAKPSTTGRKNAVAAVLLMNDGEDGHRNEDGRQQQVAGLAAGVAENGPAGDIDHAGVGEPRRHDQEPEDHDDRVAGKAGKRFARRRAGR